MHHGRNAFWQNFPNFRQETYILAAILRNNAIPSGIAQGLKDNIKFPQSNDAIRVDSIFQGKTDFKKLN